MHRAVAIGGPAAGSAAYGPRIGWCATDLPADRRTARGFPKGSNQGGEVTGHQRRPFQVEMPRGGFDDQRSGLVSFAKQPGLAVPHLQVSNQGAVTRRILEHPADQSAEAGGLPIP